MTSPQFLLPKDITLRQLETMPDPCWEWNMHRDQDGYGILKMKRTDLRVHRVFYRLFVGDIATFQLILHRCDNPPCCNPSHLFKGTNADNIADCNRKFRNAFGIRSGSAKLNDELVLKLRQRYDAGESTPDLSKAMKMSTSTMQNVIFGRTWRHVPGACTPRKSWERTR